MIKERKFITGKWCYKHWKLEPLDNCCKDIDDN